VCNSYPFPSVRLNNVSVEFWWIFESRDHRIKKIWKVGLVDSVSRLKRTHTFLDTILIASHQCGKKMFQSNVKDFSGPCHHRRSQSWKWIQMTTFNTPNIPTQFVVQFLSFPVSTFETCFGRILTTFSGLGTTGAWKVENGAQMSRFSARNVPTLFWVQFLSFRVNTTKKCFRRILMTSPRPCTSGQPKLKSGTKWERFAPQTYLHNLCCSFYHFPSVRMKGNSIEIWLLFRAAVPPGQEKLKNGIVWLGFASTHTHIIRDAVLIVLQSVRRKKFSVEFSRLFREWVPPE